MKNVSHIITSLLRKKLKNYQILKLIFVFFSKRIMKAQQQYVLSHLKAISSSVRKICRLYQVTTVVVSRIFRQFSCNDAKVYHFLSVRNFQVTGEC